MFILNLRPHDPPSHALVVSRDCGDARATAGRVISRLVVVNYNEGRVPLSAVTRRSQRPGIPLSHCSRASPQFGALGLTRCRYHRTRGLFHTPPSHAVISHAANDTAPSDLLQRGTEFTILTEAGFEN
ncbi:hypothetical protein EVAR_6992_1 [Eumeta japonica]|uniref:Uncharacterized protein n=1 Tax=Eumeta variegata TaxID=151549 RepID=A0A4C1THQ1_EUMVA|nr:hypothetical protein EVAR_6992_1 [Eumeta japonica]